MVEEVSEQAEVRQRSSSFLSSTASVRRPALTVLGATAVVVLLGRRRRR